MGIEQLYEDAEQSELDYELRVVSNFDSHLGVVINRHGITLHSWYACSKEANYVIWVDESALEDLEEIIQKAKQWRDKGKEVIT